MITPAYAAAMARYNGWQNANLYAAAATLTDAERKQNRGAFFGSIHATLNHLVWADQTWLARFGALDAPKAETITAGLTAYPDFPSQEQARKVLDRTFEQWAGALRPIDLVGDLTFRSVSYNTTLTRPRSLLIMHIFNHQTHHRGQVHAMLTAAGAKPGPTDIPVYPEMWNGLI